MTIHELDGAKEHRHMEGGLYYQGSSQSQQAQWYSIATYLSCHSSLHVLSSVSIYHSFFYLYVIGQPDQRTSTTYISFLSILIGRGKIVQDIVPDIRSFSRSDRFVLTFKNAVRKNLVREILNVSGTTLQYLDSPMLM